MPTLHDVAARAGVSHQTVSNVLNAPGRVRPETRDRVQQAIDALGYRPHRSARNLKSQRTRTIGYLVQPTVAGTISSVLDRFLHALTETARTQGYHILLFTHDEGQDDVSAFEELIATHTVDGFVISETNVGDERVQFLIDRDVPFTVFGRTGVAAPHSWVDVDNALGTALAVRHLLERGHRDIAFLGWPPGSITGDERHRGYEETLVGADIELRPDCDVRGENGVDTGRRACAQWAALQRPPSAVVCCSDLLAAGVLAEARGRDLDLAAGDQFAVIGFDDTPVAGFLSPPLSSVRQPLEEVAHAVVDDLAARIDTPTRPHIERLLAPELVLRASA